MKRKHDLLKEKSKTRDAVGQISSWCLLIALHQRFGVGADRMERIAGDAEKLQKEIAAIIDEHGTAAGIAEMQRRRAAQNAESEVIFAETLNLR